MSQLTHVTEDKIEQGVEPWIVKTLAIGGVMGALVGLMGAFLLVQNAKKKDVTQVSISYSESFRLGMLILGLLRQIATLYQE
jgi:hypothetical protein